MVFPAKGVASADIGRIASKHVKVTVSQRSLQTPSRECQTVTGSRTNDMIMNNTMNNVNAKDENRSEHEDMETDQIDGLFNLFHVIAIHITNSILKFIE